MFVETMRAMIIMMDTEMFFQVQSICNLIIASIYNNLIQQLQPFEHFSVNIYASKAKHLFVRHFNSLFKISVLKLNSVNCQYKCKKTKKLISYYLMLYDLI